MREQREARMGDIRAIAEALAEAGVRVVSANIEDDPDRLIAAAHVEAPTAVLSLVDELYGDPTLRGLVLAQLDILGVSYSGGDAINHALCMNRARNRPVLAAAGVPVPGFAVVHERGELPDTSHLRFPQIVTQAFDDLYDHEGTERPQADAEGVATRVRTIAEEYAMPLLVEEYLDGRRLHAVVIELPRASRAAAVVPAPIEILPVVEWYGYPNNEEAEAEPNDEQWFPYQPAELDEETLEQVRKLAKRAFVALGCRDFAVVDFHLGETGELCVLDVRPLPSLDDEHPFVGASIASDYGFSGLMTHIAELAHRRTVVLERAQTDPGLVAMVADANAQAESPTADDPPKQPAP